MNIFRRPRDLREPQYRVLMVNRLLDRNDPGHIRQAAESEMVPSSDARTILTAFGFRAMIAYTAAAFIGFLEADDAIKHGQNYGQYSHCRGFFMQDLKNVQ